MADDETNGQDETFSKTEFNRFVKDTLEKGERIKVAYTKLVEGTGDEKAIVTEIETLLEKIKVEYTQLFVEKDPASANTKVERLNTQLEEIKRYHTELVSGTDSSESIKDKIKSAEDDVEVSQNRITKFYIELFGSEGSENGGKEAEVNELIKDITDFHGDLTKASGYKSSIEKAHKQIIAFNEDLFVTKNKEDQTKAQQLRAEIKNISDFNNVLEKDIKDFIKDTQDDIATKRDDVGRLLGSAIGPSLLQGYLDSKDEYRRAPKYQELTRSITDNLLYVVPINLLNWLQSRLGLIADYVFFVVPLLLAVVVLSFPGNIPSVFGFDLNGDTLKDLKFFDRFLVSLPLWWISLFGYKNIRNRSHLSEEYNHKAQVTRMYIKFTSEEDPERYPIDDDARKKLNDELIETIGRNPSEIYGRDETIFDKLIKLVGSWGKVENPATVKGEDGK